MRKWLAAPNAETADPRAADPLTIGLIALSVDRACIGDCEAWLAPFGDTALFSTRVPMSPHTTPDSLRAMGDHVQAAASVLVPGTRLDAIGFACTSGTVAIGVERVFDSLSAGRPGVPVVTPMTAGVAALNAIGARRISLLVPYEVPTAEIVADYFEAAGFSLDRCTTFDLPGDPQMNALSPLQLQTAGLTAMHPESDALFISCTGLATEGALAPLERVLRRPVVTSNQSMIWDALRVAGHPDLARGNGALFKADRAVADV